jgi:beta-N-acetylhexosaminidase
MWSNKKLARQLLFLSTGSQTSSKLVQLAQAGIGGIMLQAPIPSQLAKLAGKAHKKAPSGIYPVIASDEEGGYVQRFRDRIYAIPSARKMNSKSNKKITAITKAYGKRLRAYKLDMVFGPVAGLYHKGKYLSQWQRCFSSSPKRTASKTAAWVKGFNKAGVICVYKHWPGEGEASDTHKGGSRVPSLKKIKNKDMLPFNKAFARGCEAVMVGHVQCKGLTNKGLPASLCPKAIAYLRKKCGEDTVIVTDSLSMGATTTALGISSRAAAVRALAAGVDMALVSSYGSLSKIEKAVENAIKKGRIPRKQAEAKAQRILRLKQTHGLL